MSEGAASRAAATRDEAHSHADHAALEPVHIEPTYVERIVERIIERPMRRRLPDTRQSLTHHFNVAGHEGYLTVGQYEDGTPGELFITMSKEGSTIGGLMDSLGTAISVALQYGVPVESLVTKFAHQRFEPMGMTTNRDIPFAKSLVDYIFRWMGMEFIPGYRDANAPPRSQSGKKSDANAATSAASTVVKEDNAWSETESGMDGSRITPPAPVNRMTATGHANGNGAARIDEASQPAASSRPSSGTGGGNGTNGPERVGPASGPITAQLSSHQTVASLVRDRSGAATMVVSERSNLTIVGNALDQSNAALMGDAPACGTCGSITVRNGTCYKCLNCGNSMGCS